MARLVLTAIGPIRYVDTIELGPGPENLNDFIPP
jgi:hypothetical protein